MLKLFSPWHLRDLEPQAHLEVNAALQSVPTLADMPALKCAGFLPFTVQLLKVFLDVGASGSPHGTWNPSGYVLTTISSIQHRIRAIPSCINKKRNDAREKKTYV